MRLSQLAVIALTSLGACAAPDYTPVRDWARTASLAADYPSISPHEGAPIAMGATTAPTPGSVSPTSAPAIDGILAMQEALSVYLSALATLASDGVLPFQDDPFVQLASRATAENEAGGQAVATLGAFLRNASRTNMQAPEMRDAIVAADPTVQALVAALSASVSRFASCEAESRAAVAASYSHLERQAQTEEMRQVARSIAELRDREFAVHSAAYTRYWLVLARIAEGHALLKELAPHMTHMETARRVRAAEDQLRRAAALLPRRASAGQTASPRYEAQPAPPLGNPDAAHLREYARDTAACVGSG